MNLVVIMKSNIPDRLRLHKYNGRVKVAEASLDFHPDESMDIIKGDIENFRASVEDEPV